MNLVFLWLHVFKKNSSHELGTTKKNTVLGCVGFVLGLFRQSRTSTPKQKNFHVISGD